MAPPRKPPPLSDRALAFQRLIVPSVTFAPFKLLDPANSRAVELANRPEPPNITFARVPFIPGLLPLGSDHDDDSDNDDGDSEDGSEDNNNHHNNDDDDEESEDENSQPNKHPKLSEASSAISNIATSNAFTSNAQSFPQRNAGQERPNTNVINFIMDDDSSEEAMVAPRRRNQPRRDNFQSFTSDPVGGAALQQQAAPAVLNLTGYGSNLNSASNNFTRPQPAQPPVAALAGSLSSSPHAALPATSPSTPPTRFQHHSGTGVMGYPDHFPGASRPQVPPPRQPGAAVSHPQAPNSNQSPLLPEIRSTYETRPYEAVPHNGANGGSNSVIKRERIEIDLTGDTDNEDESTKQDSNDFPTQTAQGNSGSQYGPLFSGPSQYGSSVHQNIPGRATGDETSSFRRADLPPQSQLQSRPFPPRPVEVPAAEAFPCPYAEREAALARMRRHDSNVTPAAARLQAQQTMGPGPAATAHTTTLPAPQYRSELPTGTGQAQPEFGRGQLRHSGPQSVSTPPREAAAGRHPSSGGPATSAVFGIIYGPRAQGLRRIDIADGPSAAPTGITGVNVTRTAPRSAPGDPADSGASNTSKSTKKKSSSNKRCKPGSHTRKADSDSEDDPENENEFLRSLQRIAKDRRERRQAQNRDNASTPTKGSSRRGGNNGALDNLASNTRMDRIDETIQYGDSNNVGLGIQPSNMAQRESVGAFFGLRENSSGPIVYNSQMTPDRQPTGHGTPLSARTLRVMRRSSSGLGTSSAAENKALSESPGYEFMMLTGSEEEDEVEDLDSDEQCFKPVKLRRASQQGVKRARLMKVRSGEDGCKAFKTGGARHPGLVTIFVPAAALRRIIVDPSTPSADGRCFFFATPVEVRFEIYRHLLLADAPINVLSGWSQVKRRQQTEMHPRILEVSKDIYADAIRVLYSENHFRYVLRDSAEMIPFEKGKKNAHERTINLEKFAGLFKYLELDLEANRTEAAYGKAIEGAITIPTALGARLHKFTIQIQPRVETGRAGAVVEGEYKQQTITMADHFTRNSPVISAIKNLDTVFLQINVFLEMTNNQSASRLRNMIDYRVTPSRMQIADRVKQKDQSGQEGDGSWHEKSAEQRREAAREELAKEAKARNDYALDQLSSRIENACMKGAQWVVGRKMFEDFTPSFKPRQDMSYPKLAGMDEEAASAFVMVDDAEDEDYRESE